LSGVTEFTAFHTSSENDASTIGTDLSQWGANLSATDNTYISSGISNNRFDPDEYTHSIKFIVDDPSDSNLQMVIGHRASFESSEARRRVWLRRNGATWRLDWQPVDSNAFVNFHTDPDYDDDGENAYQASLTVFNSTPGNQSVIIAIHRISAPE